jgi:hypothetical protein
MRAIARDGLVVLLLLLFAWLGVRVHHEVDALSGVGRAVSNAGLSLASTLSSAASATQDVPIVGSAIASALRGAARQEGGNVAAIGQAGVQSAHHVALVLGLLSWALPSALLVGLVLPRRLRELRQLRQARRALRAPDTEEHRRLLAVRAVLTLPDEALFRHAADPAGDLLAGRYSALAAAELEAMGVKPR